MSGDLTPIIEDNEITTMSFFDALKKIQEGKRVARASWGNRDYCLLKDGYLSIFTRDNVHRWLINDGDMEGQDWIIVTEGN
jgi:hypothetical protein